MLVDERLQREARLRFLLLIQLHDRRGIGIGRGVDEGLLVGIELRGLHRDEQVTVELARRRQQRTRRGCGRGCGGGRQRGLAGCLRDGLVRIVGLRGAAGDGEIGDGQCGRPAQTRRGRRLTRRKARCKRFGTT